MNPFQLIKNVFSKIIDPKEPEKPTDQVKQPILTSEIPSQKIVKKTNESNSQSDSFSTAITKSNDFSNSLKDDIIPKTDQPLNKTPIPNNPNDESLSLDNKIEVKVEPAHSNIIQDNKDEPTTTANIISLPSNEPNRKATTNPLNSSNHTSTKPFQRGKLIEKYPRKFKISYETNTESELLKKNNNPIETNTLVKGGASINEENKNNSTNNNNINNQTPLTNENNSDPPLNQQIPNNQALRNSTESNSTISPDKKMNSKATMDNVYSSPNINDSTDLSKSIISNNSSFQGINKNQKPNEASNIESKDLTPNSEKPSKVLKHALTISNASNQSGNNSLEIKGITDKDSKTGISSLKGSYAPGETIGNEKDLQNLTNQKGVESEKSVKFEEDKSKKPEFKKKIGDGKNLKYTKQISFMPVEVINITPNPSKLDSHKSIYKPFFLTENRYKDDRDKKNLMTEKAYILDDFEDPLDRLERDYQRVIDKNAISNYDLKIVFPVTQNSESINYIYNVSKIHILSDLTSFFYEELISNSTNQQTLANEDPLAIGFPKIISLYQNKYVIIGTSTGLVFVFDNQETILLTLECKEFKKICVTSLSFTEDFSTMIVGYENGGIAVYHIMTKTILKIITDLHKSKIICILVLQNGPIAFVSVDISGELYKTEVNQSIFFSEYYTKTSDIIKKDCNNIIKMNTMNADMRAKYILNPIDEEYLRSIFVVVSYDNVIVYCLQPKLKALLTFDRPNYLDGKPNIASTTWLYTCYLDESRTYLVIGWGRIVHLIEFDYKNNEGVPNAIFNFVGYKAFENDIKYVSTLAKNLVVVIDNSNIIYILHFKRFRLGEFEAFENGNELYEDYILTIKELTNCEITPTGYIKKDELANNAPYYEYSIFCSSESKVIYLITSKNIMRVTLKNAFEYLEDIFAQDDLIKYLTLGLEIINNHTPILYEIPDKDNERLNMFLPLINKRILNYIESSRFNGLVEKRQIIDNQGIPNSNPDNSNSELKPAPEKPETQVKDQNISEISVKIAAIIDFESQVKDFKTLFDDIKLALEKKNCFNLFLSELEPFIACDRISKIPDLVLRDIIKFYCAPEKLEYSKHLMIQKLLTKLDLSESDPTFLTTLCLEFDLDSALFYISAEIGNNFAFPLIKLLNDIKFLLEPDIRKGIKRSTIAETVKNSLQLPTQLSSSSAIAIYNTYSLENNDKKKQKKQELGCHLGYKALWYLKSCLKQTIFFSEEQIDHELWKSIVCQIKLIFFEESNLKILLKIDPYITLSLILLFFFGELSDLAENEHVKIYNIIIEFLYDPSNFAHQKKFEIFLTGKLIESGHRSILDENTIYKVLETYWTNPMLLEDKIFITYYKIMLPYKNDKNEIVDVMKDLKQNITLDFIKKERDKFSENFVKHCKNILDKKKILNLLDLLLKSKIDKKDLIKNDLMLMHYVVDQVENPNIIDEDILILYVEMLSMIRKRNETKKILGILKRFNYYPLAKMIDICKEYNIKDAWAYLESKNGNFDKSLILSYEVFCAKVRKYFEYNKNQDWKKIHAKLKAKLDNILENLKLITCDYKEYWFEYLHKLCTALHLRKVYENNKEELKEFSKIHDAVLDKIMNGIIDSVPVKEIIENIRGKYSDMPPELIRKLLIKLMSYYFYERKAYLSYSELVLHDYANLILQYSNLLLRGTSMDEYCGECMEKICPGQRTGIFFCRHVFHYGTCLKQNYCPTCHKSGSNLLINLMIVTNLKSNKANPKPMDVIPDLGVLDKRTKLIKAAQKKNEERNRKILTLNAFEHVRQHQNIGWLAFADPKNKKLPTVISL